MAETMHDAARIVLARLVGEQLADEVIRELAVEGYTVVEKTQLAALVDAAGDLTKRVLAHKPRLLQPYVDEPDSNPWDQFIQAPCSRLYGLVHRFRKEKIR